MLISLIRTTSTFPSLLASSMAVSGCAPLLEALPWNPTPKGSGITGFYEAQAIGYTLQTCGLDTPPQSESLCDTQYSGIRAQHYDQTLQCSKKLWEDGSLAPVYRRWAGVTHRMLSSMGGPGVFRIQVCAAEEDEAGALNEDPKVMDLLSRFGLARGVSDLKGYFHGSIVESRDVPGSRKIALIYADIHLREISADIAKGVSYLGEEGLRLFASEGLPKDFQLTCRWAQTIWWEQVAQGYGSSAANAYLVSCNPPVEVWGIEDRGLFRRGVLMAQSVQESRDPDRYSAFMENADARSYAMARNFRELVERRKEDRAAVLYTGAAHVPLVAEELGRFGISYLVIVPKTVSIRSYQRIARDHRELGVFLAKRGAS